MADEPTEIKFLLEGISCSGCAMDMENILLGLDGVEEASVNYIKGEFVILYDPEKIAGKTIVEKVKNLGFKAKLLSE